MSIKHHICKLGEGDVLPVIAVARAAFPGEGLLRSIYRAQGIATHIMQELRNPFSPYEYFVARIATAGGEEVAGFCECRLLPGGVVCLNMIATAPGYKGSGIGNALMRFCIDRYKAAGKTELVLDVLGSNRHARNWYERTGFNQYREKHIYSLPQASGEAEGIYLLNYPQYNALMAVYGFAHLQVMSGAHTTGAGVIGSDIFINANNEEGVQAGRIAGKRLQLQGTYLVTDAIYNKAKAFIDHVAGMRLVLKVPPASHTGSSLVKPAAII